MSRQQRLSNFVLTSIIIGFRWEWTQNDESVTKSSSDVTDSTNVVLSYAHVQWIERKIAALAIEILWFILPLYNESMGTIGEEGNVYWIITLYPIFFISSVGRGLHIIFRNFLEMQAILIIEISAICGYLNIWKLEGTLSPLLCTQYGQALFFLCSRP